jgi:hypothetical protein
LGFFRQRLLKAAAGYAARETFVVRHGQLCAQRPRERSVERNDGYQRSRTARGQLGLGKSQYIEIAREAGRQKAIARRSDLWGSSSVTS